MANKKKIMAWSKCNFRIGKTGGGDTMSDKLFSIGTIKDKSSSLEASDGDVLEMKATGGETVAEESLEGGFKAVTRVIEPTDELESQLGIARTVAEEQQVTTHIVEGDWSLQITPKNVGAKGIKAPKCSIKYKPGWSEEDGNYADIEFNILKGDAGYWYSRFRKKEPLVVSPLALDFTNTADSNGKTITATCSASTVKASSSETWCTAAPSSKTVKVTVTENNTGFERVAEVTIQADGKEAVVTVVQAAK